MGKLIEFGKLMLQVARRYPDREAIVNLERKRRFTFMEHHLLTNRICNMLKSQFGLNRGDVYYTMLENDNMSLFTFWLWKAEASGSWTLYRTSMEEHLWQIDFIKPKVVFIENAILDQYYPELRRRGIRMVCMDPLNATREGVDCFWNLVEEASDAETNVEHDRDEDILLYRYTGGTTGKGKCVPNSLANMYSMLYGYYDNVETLIPHHTRHLHVTPLSHASSLWVLPIYFKGGTSVTVNQADLTRFCEYVQKERITHTFLVPTVLYRLLESELEKLYDLSSLETVFYGASPMDPEKVKALQSKFGNIFVQAYGATETFGPLTLLAKSEHVAGSAEDLARLRSAGRPVASVEIGIFDERGRELPYDEKGEIWIRGPGNIRGYHRNLEQTKEEFTSSGWWKSGDMGYVDRNGYIYIIDRKKNMIVTGGFNVYASEVEECINSHPAVLMSAVIGVPHDEWGEAVHAEVILKKGARISEGDLIEHVKRRKGGIKTPKSFSFVQDLPVTAAGKILHRKIREKYWEGKERKVG